MSDTASASLTLDTSAAVSNANQLMQAFGSISQSGIAMFAAVEEAGQGLEDLGGKVLGAVSASVSAATQIQSAQAQLTAQSYNFSESLGQNEAQSKALTSQLIAMATSIRQPISNIQQLAGTIAQMGYSGEQIPVMTKDFAEFGAVAGVNANLYAKSINQIAVQTHTSVGSMNSMLGALYSVGKETSGGMPGLLSMTDRMASLSLATGMTGQEFIAMAAYSQDFDSRLRGGAFGALTDFDNLLNKSIGNPNTNNAVMFFKFLGNGSIQAGKAIADQQDKFNVFSTFISNLAGQKGVSAANALSNIGITNPSSQTAFYEMANAQGSNKTLQSYLSQANQAWSSGTDVQTAYQAIQSTTASQMIGLKDTITQLSNTVGQDLLPAFTSGAHILQDFTSVATMVPAPILAIGAGLAGVAALATIGLGAVTKIAGIWRGISGIGNAGGSAAQTGGNAAATASTTASTEATTTNTAELNQNTSALAANSAAKTESAAATTEAATQLEMFDASLAATSAALTSTDSQLALFGEGVSTITVEANAFDAEIEQMTGALAAFEAAMAEMNAMMAETGATEVALTAETEAATAGSAGFAASLGTWASAAAGAAAGVGILVAALTAGDMIEKKFADDAQNTVNAFSKNIDTSSVDGISKAIDQANSKIGSLKKSTSGSLIGQTFSWSNISTFGGAHDTSVKEIKDYQTEVNTLQGTLNAAKAIAQQFWQTASPSNDEINQVLSTASQNLINIATGGKQAASSVESLLQVNTTQAASQNQQQLDTLGQAAMDLVTQQETLLQSTDSVAAAQIQAGEAARALAVNDQAIAEAANQVSEAQLGVTQASLNTQQAQISLANAGMQLAQVSLLTANAQAKLQDAEDATKAATISLFEAQLQAGEAAQQQQLTLASATLALSQSNVQAETSTTNLAAAQWNLYKIGADYALQYKSALNQVADSTLGLQQAQISASNAQWQLTYLQEEGASQRDIQLAQLTLAQANQQVTDTSTQLQQAQQNVNQMPTDHSIQLAQAQDQLNSATLNVTASTLQEQQAALALYNAQQEAAANTTIITANLNLKNAQDKVTESQAATLQAQENLNAIQSGSIQLAYNSAVLQVQQSELKEHDAAYAVTTAQLNLNNAQDGAAQLALKRATDQVTQAQLQNQQAAATLANDQAILAGNESDAYTQASNLATLLLNSGNPSLHAMGVQLENALPAMANLTGATSNFNIQLDAQNTALAAQIANMSTATLNAQQMAAQFNAALTAGENLNAQMPKQAIGTPAATAFAVGAYVTRPTYAMVGEAGPELVLPLNDMNRSLELLQQAGLVDSSGMPTSAYSSPNSGIVPVTTSGSIQNTQSKTTNNTFNLTAITQPASPEEIMNQFAWQQRLVSA